MFILFKGTEPLGEGSFEALATQRSALAPEAQGSALILSLRTGDIAYGPEPAPPAPAAFGLAWGQCADEMGGVDGRSGTLNRRRAPPWAHYRGGSPTKAREAGSRR